LGALVGGTARPPPGPALHLHLLDKFNTPSVPIYNSFDFFATSLTVSSYSKKFTIIMNFYCGIV
jgi:hypothetical protein